MKEGAPVTPWAGVKETTLHLLHLGGANLRQADFRGADLEGAYLGGADLYDANLSKAKLEGMIIDDGTYHEDGTLRTYVIGKK